MKSVLISIKPYWFYLICERLKTIEIRKTFPKSVDWDRRTYLYCTKDMKSFNKIPYDKKEKYHKFFGKVGASFVVDFIVDISIKYSDPDNRLSKREFPYTCMTDKEIIDYLGNGGKGYAWHISELKIYDDPKSLKYFYHYGVKRGSKVTRPPQSWCYVDELR